eukprot:6272228-Pyramimonas_sp.AAC.3
MFDLDTCVPYYCSWQQARAGGGGRGEQGVPKGGDVGGGGFPREGGGVDPVISPARHGRLSSSSSSSSSSSWSSGRPLAPGAPVAACGGCVSRQAHYEGRGDARTCARGGATDGAGAPPQAQ